MSTRYLIGVRASADLRSGLKVLTRPPTFYTPPASYRGDRRERIGWQSSSYDFHAKRGSLEEFHANGRHVVARVATSQQLVGASPRILLASVPALPTYVRWP